MWLTLAGLALNIVIVIVGGMWALGNSRQAIFNEMRESRTADQRIFGETILALRQKINDVELEGYKTFVRRDSFHEMMKQMQETNNARFDKIDGKLDRLAGMRPNEQK